MSVKIIECPRDAMQGIHEFIDTETKVRYLNQLLKVGYHTLDCGSFVSPKAIPQMKDTADVLNALDLEGNTTRLSVIVANRRGVDDAMGFPMVNYLGFPFSVSEEFQHRNTNKAIEDAVGVVRYIEESCRETSKEVVVYISMGFGNNYGEKWSPDLVAKWVERLATLGIRSFSISDTVGVANAQKVEDVYRLLLKEFPEVEFGAHFHTTPEAWREKVDAAWSNGCMRFDGAIGGFGGCPMAEDDLVGNMPTERLLQFFEQQGEETGIDKEQFYQARLLAAEIFP